jgi:hypothetical protein
MDSKKTWMKAWWAITRITIFIHIQKYSKDNLVATRWMTTLLWSKRNKNKFRCKSLK